jgi:tRNA(Ile2) C34 agmatinyltransferase TiaS
MAAKVGYIPSASNIANRELTMLPPVTEYQLMLVLHDKCPRCRGELDTGWECNRCGYDAKWLADILFKD